MPPAADRSGHDRPRPDPPSRPPSGLQALVVGDEIPLASLPGSHRQRGGFDVIVLDLGLPGLEGIEVCREIRKSTDSHISVSTSSLRAVTSNHPNDRTFRLSRLGADDFLSKPFSPRS